MRWKVFKAVVLLATAISTRPATALSSPVEEKKHYKFEDGGAGWNLKGPMYCRPRHFGDAFAKILSQDPESTYLDFSDCESERYQLIPSRANPFYH